MKLLERINQDLKKALKAKDSLKVSTLRFLLAAIKDKEIELNKRGQLSEPEVMNVVQKQVKKRRESVLAYRKASRLDLADKESQEMDILSNYLPQEIGDEDLKKIIQEEVKILAANDPKDFGKVMSAVMKKVAAQAEGAKVADFVREALGAK